MSKWMAYLHRISGTALALFLPVHFWALGRGLELDAFLVWTQQPLVKFAEWGLVVLLAAHLGGGLRVLALEFLPWRDWQKGLAAAAAAVAFAAGLAFALGAFAQSWPQKPVRLIVPFPPGGATDIAARLLGEKLAQTWGQSVVIENRGGAGGSLGAAEAARAAPDGYTLFFPSGSVITANQHIYTKLNYDPEKDFVPITNVVSGAQVIVVSAKSPYKTLKDLIEAAKAKPGKVTFGHAGIGSQTHLAGENFLFQAKIEAVSVPFKGEGPALASLIAEDIDFVPSNLAAAIGYVNGGRIRALGVTSKQSAPQLPGVPPIGETVPGFENSGWWGLVAPAGTPREIVQKVYQDTKNVLGSTELKARFYAQGLAPVGNTPEEFAKTITEETALWAKVVKQRKIQIQ
jgi:tripartite-type tricarboxylate transporter receptor subunit TctC